MLRLPSLPSVVRVLTIAAVVAIGCGAPHSGKGHEADVGSTAEALSFQGTGDPTKVTPSLKCVTQTGGHYVGVFGVTNSTSSTIVIPSGAKNTLSPVPFGASQPSVFSSGTQYFSIGFVGPSIKWTLGAGSATAKTTSTACNVTTGTLGPIAQVGSAQVPLRVDPATVLANAVVATETDATGLAEGAIPAGFSVTQDGASSYALKLWTPPGRSMQPELSLVYNSRADADHYGVGWQLASVFSQITRCSKTIAQEQEAGPVGWENDGPFCLDGRKLVPFGTNEFRPENDEFTRVTTTPDRSFFTVFERNGRTRLYGASGGKLFGTRRFWDDVAKSFVDAPQQVLSWALEKVSDRFGNQLTIDYRLLRSGTGQRFAELLPTTITYSPGRRIEIKYDDEVPQPSGDTFDTPAPRFRFVGGFGLATTRVVTRIRMFGPDPVSTAMLREYRLLYKMKAALTARPLLKTVRECDRAGICLPPTSFDWNEGDGRFVDKPIGPQFSERELQDRVNLVAIDLNGDGMDDVYYRHPDGFSTGGPRIAAYRLGTALGLGGDLSAPVFENLNGLQPIDWFMDGHHELMGTNVGIGPGALLFRLQGGNFESFDVPQIPFGMRLPRFVADLNGDGVPDLLDPKAGLSRFGETWGILVNPGRDTANPAMPVTAVFRGKNVAFLEHRGTATYVADVDGSGRNALLARERTEELLDDAGTTGPIEDFARYVILRARNTQLARPNGQPPATITELQATGTPLPAGEGSSDSFHYVLVDLNGDGLADALQVPHLGGAPQLAMNNGENFESLILMPSSTPMAPVVTPQAPPQDEPVVNPGVRVADWNGDGASDLILLGGNGQGSNVLAYTFDQENGRLSSNPLFDTDGNPIPVGQQFVDGFAAAGFLASEVLDANGDGLPDFVQFVNRQLHLYLHAGSKPDQLRRIVEGDGQARTYEVTYASSHDADHQVYTPGDACIYPQHCVRKGMWFVASYTVTGDNDVEAGGRKRHFDYQYGDARSDLTGRGFVSIGSRTERDAQTGTVTTTVYDNVPTDVPAGQVHLGYPTAGLPKAEIVATPLSSTAAAKLWHVTSTVRQYQVTFQGTGLERPPDSPFNVRPGRVEEKVMELLIDEVPRAPGSSVGDLGVVDVEQVPGAEPASVLSHVTTTYDSYDEFNNLTQSTTTWSSGETRTYRGTYLNETGATDPNLFILGMQTRSELTSSPRPGESTKRVVTYEPDPRTGFLSAMHVQPDVANAEQRVDVAYTRNGFGQITLSLWTATDPLDATPMTRTEATSYDDGDGVFPSSVTNALGHTIQMIFHPGLGVLGFQMDPNGVKTWLQCDGFGRLRTRATDGRGPLTVSYRHIAVDGAGLPNGITIHTEQTGGGASTVFYNELGHPVLDRARSTETSDSSVETRYTNVLDGEIASVTRPFFVETAGPPTRQFIEYTYDALGRVLTQKLPNGSVTSHVYNGLIEEVTDPQGNRTSKRIDELGRVSTTTELIEQSSDFRFSHLIDTNYVYGPFNTVTEVNLKKRIVSPIDEDVTLLRTAKLTYDDLGRRKHLDDPEAGPSDRTYNAFGEIVQDQFGDPLTMPAVVERVTYMRDQLGRVVSEAPLSEGPNTFQWDTATFGVGKLASSASSDGTARGYSYFSNGQIQQARWTISGVAYAADYKYDTVGRLDRLSYPTVSGRSRFAVSYHYDVTGVADAICDARLAAPTAPCDNASASKPIWQANSRQADGQLLKETFGNDEITVREYADPRGFLTKIQTTRGTATNQAIQYSYDKNGNLASRFDNLPLINGQTFGYDALNRLTSVEDVAQKTGFTYDDLGNFTSRVVTSAGGGAELSRLDYSFVPSATPHSDMVVNGTRYWFDGRGRNTRVGTEWFASREVTYTPFDLPRLIKVSDGSQQWQFKYDADHRRVEKRNFNERSSTYVGDLYEKHKDWDSGSGFRHIFYVHGPERVVAQLEFLDSDTSDTFLYLHDDHLGSVDAVTDQSGAVQKFQYDVFGARAPSQVKIVRKGFTFHRHDDDVTEQADNPGIIDMKGRIYDAKIGRFMTADPIVPLPSFSQRQNRYAYALNNPLIIVDPSGFDCDAASSGGPGFPPSGCRTKGGAESRIGGHGSGGTKAGGGDGASGGNKTGDGGNNPVPPPKPTPGAGASHGAHHGDGGPPEGGKFGSGQGGGSDPGGRRGNGAGGSGSGETGARGPMSGSDGAHIGSVGGGSLGGNAFMQGALMVAGLYNFVDAHGIRTDGTGNPLGIPGGRCETCEGSRLAQAVYLGSTLFQLFSGAFFAMLRDAQEFITLLHGSDVASVENIVANGIDREAAAALGGGDVFWTTMDKGVATIFARANPAGGAPAIAAMKMSKSAFQALVKSGAVELHGSGAYIVQNWEAFSEAVIERTAISVE